MSGEIPRNLSFNRATYSQRSRGDSSTARRTGSEDWTAGENDDYPQMLNLSVTRSGSTDSSSMYGGRSPSSLHHQSAWRRPSGASNASNNPRRPSGASAAMARRPSSSSGQWNSRMSNDSSNFSTHTAAQSPSSTPSTPKNRSSSRSKILASSAEYLGNSPPITPHSPPPPHSRNSSFSADVHLPSPVQHQAGKGSILVSSATGQSVLERKRRLAAASGNSIYDDTYTESSSISTTSQRRFAQNSDQSSNLSSGGDSSSNRRPSSARQATNTSLRTVSGKSDDFSSLDGGKDDSPTSLKKRLFGLKKDKSSPRDNSDTSSIKSRTRNYGSQYRPSTANEKRSPSLLERDSFEILDSEGHGKDVESIRSKSNRMPTSSASFPNRKYSEPTLVSQREYNEVPTDYSRSTGVGGGGGVVSGLAPPALLQSDRRSSSFKRSNTSDNSASLRSSTSDSSMKRFQNEGQSSSDRPSSRDHRRGRTNSKGSASVHSVASLTSNGSIPARTTSLKTNRTVPSSPNPNFAALVSPSSSYKSIPTSPDLHMSTDETTLSSSPIKASLNRTNLGKHSSWRQSSNLGSAAAAAGVSGASALAAIRASFGEPTRQQQQETHQADANEQSDIANSLSLAALRILEESDSTAQVQDGGIEAAMSKLTGNETVESVNTNETSKLPIPNTSANKEPLRPVKSPLRNNRNRLSTVVSESGHESRSIAMSIENQDVTSSQFGSIAEKAGTDEGMISNDAVAGSNSSVDLTKASVSRPSLHQRDKSQSSMSNNGSITNLAGDSVLSLPTTDDGQEGGQSKGDSSKKRYKTLAKVKPSVFNKAFGKHGNPASTSVEDHSTNLSFVDEDTPVSIPSSISGTATGRKKSIWRLGIGKDDSSSTVGHGNDGVSTKSKLGMSIRGRKSEVQSVRPTIRRVFDHPSPNESSATGYTDYGEDSKTSTPTADRSFTSNTTQGSFGTLRNISHDSLNREVGMDSPIVGAPGTPQTPSDNLPTELKRLIRRCNAIRELVETEKTYAADLAIVRDIYLARAKVLAGFSVSSPLATPLSSSTTPILSPAVGTPSSIQNPFQPSSANYLSFKGATSSPTQWNSNHSMRNQTSSDAPPASLASPAQIQSSTTLNSTGPSNRSSTYTVSSNTSSDLSFHWPPNGSSLPGTPSVGAPSSTHKSVNAPSAGSPAPSLQQQQQQQGKNTRISRIQTSVSGTPTLMNDGPLSSSDMRIIFAHLETCCSLAFDMTSLLTSCMGSVAKERQPVQNGKSNVDSQHQNDDRIGNLFVSLMPRIEAVFTAYCSRHEASVLRFQDLINHSTKVANFFRECNEMARKNTTSWDLASLLIKPVQRVLKYPLLLRQIVGLTNSSHPDYVQLNTALAQIQEVADKINQVKRRKDLADFIITGRDRDAKSSTSSPLSTLPAKGKKKGGMLTPRTSNNAANPDESMLSLEALDKALDEYAELCKRFEALQSRVAIFGRQCGTWSHAVREGYYAQLRMLGYLRRIYTLRPQDELDGINGGVNRANLPSGPEDAMVAAYMDVLKAIINRSWRQMDTEIRTAILPMTTKIEKMFDAPRSVMGKVEERESDFVRARIALQQHQDGKNVDRKVLENANGYVALQAQLIDEMPTFMRGIQLLLDVGVQAFARLQAAHLNEVRNLTIEFWTTKAGHEDEVDMIGVDDEDTLDVGPSLRNVNPVRAFWESHRAYSQWSDSLSIVRRGSELSAIPSVDYDDLSDSEDEDGSGEAGFAEALAKANLTELTQRKPSSSSLSQSRRPSGQAANSASGHGPSFLLPTSGGGRRPSGGGVVGLMRTLSGTFSRDNASTPTNSTEGELPPMPNDATSTIRMHRAAAAAAAAAAAEQSKDGSTRERMDSENDVTVGVSSLPPSLPSLVFRDDDDTGEGFFVQNSPIAFLDTAENVGNKEPYDISPSLVPVSRNASISTTNSSAGAGDSSHDNSTLSVGHDGNTSTRSGSFVSAGSTRTFGMASRENSGDRLHHQSTLDSIDSEGSYDGSNKFTSIPGSRSYNADQNTSSPKSPSSSSQRQKIQTLFRSKALKDGPNSSQKSEKHLGWPFISYSTGDTFRVLSTDSSSSPGQTLLFGRSDVSGEMGWVAKVDFVKVEAV